MLLPVRDAGRDALGVPRLARRADARRPRGDRGRRRLSRRQRRAAARAARPATRGCASCARRRAGSPPPSTWRSPRRAQPVVARMDADDVAHPSGSRLQAERLARDAARRRARLPRRDRRAGARGRRGHAGLRRLGRTASSTTTRWPATASSSRRSCTPRWRCGAEALARARRLPRLRRARGLRPVAARVRRRPALREAPRGRCSSGATPPAGSRGRTRATRARAFVRLKVAALARGPLAGRAGGRLGRRPDREGLRAGARGRRAARRRVRRGRPAQDRPAHPRRAGASRSARRGASRGALHLGAVGQTGARERIREEAARLGLVDGEDFFAVA